MTQVNTQEDMHTCADLHAEGTFARAHAHTHTHTHTHTHVHPPTHMQTHNIKTQFLLHKTLQWPFPLHLEASPHLLPWSVRPT